MAKHTFENDAILFLSDARGQFIPRDFAASIKRECVTGISDEDYDILSDPENEWYWDTWNDVEQRAIVTNPKTKVQYSIWQNGDCWLVPIGCEIPEW